MLSDGAVIFPGVPASMSVGTQNYRAFPLSRVAHLHFFFHLFIFSFTYAFWWFCDFSRCIGFDVRRRAKFQLSMLAGRYATLMSVSESVIEWLE